MDKRIEEILEGLKANREKLLSKPIKTSYVKTTVSELEYVIDYIEKFLIDKDLIPGEEVYLSKDMVEPGTSYRPSFLFGVFGEKVKLIECHVTRDLYLVRGPTLGTRKWWCEGKILLRTKPVKN